MDKDLLRSCNNGSTNNDRGLLKDPEISIMQTTKSDFVFKWGNRKRVRCMKAQVRDDSAVPAHQTTVPAVRVKKDTSNQPSTDNHNTNGHFNLRQRPSSLPTPTLHRVIRNAEYSGAMRGQSNVCERAFASPDRGAHDKRGTRNNNNNNNNHNHHNNDNNKSGASSETAHDSKKGGSSSPSGEAAPPTWPPKFVITLTNKEKEEDFMAIKGSKLPQRPKKRAKFIQRTVNLVSPGAWLCDLTLERYEVREKKITKKRPRGLKAMGNVDSDSE